MASNFSVPSTLFQDLRNAVARTGPMAVGINQGGIFARTDRTLDRPDVQFHVATLSSDMAGSPTHTFPGFTFSVCQLRPESRGTVRIKSADPLESPAMQPNYLSTARDQQTLLAGLRLARRLASLRRERSTYDVSHPRFRQRFCRACFTGDYPIPVPTDSEKLRFEPAAAAR